MKRCESSAPDGLADGSVRGIVLGDDGSVCH